MKKLLLILCGITSLNAYAETVILNGYISGGGTAYIPEYNFTSSSGRDYQLGSSEQMSGNMSDMMEKAGCRNRLDNIGKPDCKIKVQLNKKKDTIIKVISAQKLTNS